MGRFAGTDTPTTTATTAPSGGEGGGRFARAGSGQPVERKKGKSLGDKAKSVGGGILRTITAPLGAVQQATFRVGSGIGEAIEGRPGEALKELGRGAKELGTLGLGQEDISFEEATVDVRDREAFRRGEVQSNLANIVGKDAAAKVGLAGDILLDPLLPTAFSKAKNIKQATKVTEKVLGKEAGERVAKQGIKGLTAKEQGLLKSGVAQLSLETTATGGRRSLAEIAKGVKAPSKMTAQEGAERLVGKTIKGLEQAEKALPATAIGRAAEKLPSKVAHTARLDKAATAIKEKSWYKLAEEVVKPRAAIARNWGEEVAARFKGAGDETLARTSRRVGDTMAETNARMNRLVANGGKMTAEESKLMGAALRGEKWAQDTIKATRLNEVFDYVNKLEGKSRVIAEASTGGKVAAPAAKAAPKAGAAAAAAVPEGGSELEKLVAMLQARGMGVPKTVAERVGVAPSEGVAGIARGKAAGEKTIDLDKTLGGTIGDENPIADVLNRHFSAVHAEETGTQLGKLKSVIQDADGNPLLREVKPGEKLPDGWTTLKSKHWTGHAAPREIATEIDRVGNLLDDSTALGRLDRIVNRYDKFWKTSATSLPVNAAFTLRNARSNLFLNWLDGLWTLGPYREAKGIQMKARDIMKTKKFQDEVIRDGVQAVMKRNMTPREYRIWDLAQQNRIIGGGYAGVEQTRKGITTVGRVKGVSTPESVGGKVRRGAETFAEKGRGFNELVENNARLANFIHNLDRTGDAKLAAEHTHKFLFDYGDLTDVEQQRIKKWVPFYTFMRKNTPLQIEQIIKQPGKIGTRLKLGEAVTEDLPEGSPSYLQRQQARKIPGGVAGALGVSGVLALTPDTPLSAAMQTVEPFSNFAKALPAIATGDAEKLEDLPADVWRPLVSLLGGARGAPLKAIMGEAAQRDLFSGAEVPPGDVRMRAAQAFLPFVGRALSTLPKEKQAEILSHLSQKKVTKEDKEAISSWILRQAGIKVREVK